MPKNWTIKNYKYSNRYKYKNFLKKLLIVFWFILTKVKKNFIIVPIKKKFKLLKLFSLKIILLFDLMSVISSFLKSELILSGLLHILTIV